MKPELARRKKMTEQYRSRTNAAVDYIERNLNQDFSLDQVAAVAGFFQFLFI